MIHERMSSLQPLVRCWHALPREDVQESIARIAEGMPCSGDARRYAAQVFDASNASRDEVTRWLRSLALPAGLVRVYWIAQQEGVAMELGDFVGYYDDLWFPGADDVWITSADETWVLEFDHEEKLTLWLLHESQRGCEGVNHQ